LHGRHNGVAIVVWLGDTVLAVRHSYKPGLCLPGGGVGLREDHQKAAVRELREEVGLKLDAATLRLLASTLTPCGPVYLYETRIEAMPKLTIDRREIIEARFVPPLSLYELHHRTTILGHGAPGFFPHL
jgi:8-oxo-dGTP pyrophosphatase MutT (NUDIX family)